MSGSSQSLLLSTELAPTHGPAHLTLIEGPWSRAPFPGRYRLLSGSWPHRPGELALSRAAVTAGAVGPEVALASGHVRARVTGTYLDRYSTGAVAALMAPGSWNSWPLRTLEEAGFSPSAGVFVLGNFRDWAAAERIARTRVDSAAGVDLVVNRALIRSRPRRSAVDAHPLAFRAPMAGAAIAGTLLLFGLALRRHNRHAETLRAVGLRPVTAAFAVLLGTMVCIIAALLVGTGTGVALGALGRAAVAPVMSQPLSPVASPVAEAIRYAGLVVITSAAVLLATLLAVRRSPRRQRRARPALALPMARRAVGLFALAAIGFLAPGADAVADMQMIAWLAAAVVVLFVPDALAAIGVFASQMPPAMRLATRRMTYSSVRVTALAAVVVVIFAPFVTNAAISQSASDYDRSHFPFFFPEGLYALGAPDSDTAKGPDPEAVAIARRVNGGEPVLVRSAYSRRNDWYVVAPGGRLPTLRPTLIVLPSSEAFRALLGRRADQAALRTLAGGGVVVYGPEAAMFRAPIGMNPVDGEWGVPSPRLTKGVLVRQIPRDQAWSVQASGFLLARTASALGVPSKPRLAVFPSRQPQEAARVKSALQEAGQPTAGLQQRQVFEPLPESTATVVARYSLGLLLAALGTVSVLGSARALRRDSAVLVSIGLNIRWARRVLLLETLMMVGIAVVAGVVASSLVFAVAVARTPLPVVVPLEVLAVVATAAAILVALAAIVGVARLRPRGARAPSATM